MPGEKTDEELMMRISEGDLSAFDALFVRHQRGVYNFLFRCLGDSALAEDQTQECFLRVWRARERYQPKAAFRTWLFAIARRLALDERKRRSLATVPLSSGRDEEESGTPLRFERRASDPQALLLAREKERAFEAALDRLPRDLREALVLRDMEGLSYEEIAEVIGRPVGTVRSRLHTARERLRQAMADWTGES
jgi:RNA polymerase sigma-70 factor (ECF subfamily)